MKSLIDVHGFTGCDAISGFARRGKVKPLKLMLRDTRCVEAFSQLGEQTGISRHLSKIINLFVWYIYGWEGKDLVDETRYRLYCQSGRKMSCQQLPPFTDVLELHVMRANYQAQIWRKSLMQIQTEANPEDHGWMLDDDNNKLDIRRMRCGAAPDEAMFQVLFYPKNKFLTFNCGVFIVTS